MVRCGEEVPFDGEGFIPNTEIELKLVYYAVGMRALGSPRRPRHYKVRANSAGRVSGAWKLREAGPFWMRAIQANRGSSDTPHLYGRLEEVRPPRGENPTVSNFVMVEGFLAQPAIPYVEGGFRVGYGNHSTITMRMEAARPVLHANIGTRKGWALSCGNTSLQGAKGRIVRSEQIEGGKSIMTGPRAVGVPFRMMLFRTWTTLAATFL